MKRATGILGALMIAGCGPASNADFAFKEGKWSMTLDTTASFPDVPPTVAPKGFSMSDKDSFEFCMTPEMIANPRKVLLGGLAEFDCADEAYRMERGRIEAKANCAATEQVRNFSVKGEYDERRFQVERTSDRHGPSNLGRMLSTMKVEARRIGDCSAQEMAAARSNSEWR